MFGFNLSSVAAKFSAAVQGVSDAKIEAAKGTPAVVGAAASMMTLNTWVMIGTGLYIIVQIAYLVRKWWREEKDWARGRKPRHRE